MSYYFLLNIYINCIIMFALVKKMLFTLKNTFFTHLNIVSFILLPVVVVVVKYLIMYHITVGLC